MSEFTHYGQSPERLFNRLQELQEINQPWQGVERRKQISHEMACIIFEQMSVYAEDHHEIAEAVL